MDGWIAFSLNITGIGAAVVAPISVLRRDNKAATFAALVAIGHAVLTIIGLVWEWHDHYLDFKSDLFLFGLLTVLTGLSGSACLRIISRKKPTSDAAKEEVRS